MPGVREERGEQLAQWLTAVAVALFIANGVVLAVDAHSYGWAALLFAAAVYIGVSTGALGRPLRPSTASVQRADTLERYRPVRGGPSTSGAVDALAQR